ncbi:MAG: SUMF1/EgtB/PvdO family nonheme iron enzyme [Chloroflexi bacterium]|nr:SUMF1/EgtB/PvdO family nonheme iron enzyme [Chloroflexota bacterium]
MNPPERVLIGREDQYTLVERIGSGGFGTVWRARRSNGQPVAVKQSHDPEEAQRFVRECAVLRDVWHDNLPRYREGFVDARGDGYLVMEYVPGEDLAATLKRQGRLAREDVVYVARQVCDALECLHTRTPPVIHRDIKPANIRRTAEGLVKLVDFGLMKEGHGPTSRHGFTTSFAPLEQLQSGHGPTDARSDIYSLATTLYVLVTGRPPPMALERKDRIPDPLPPPQSGDDRLDAAIVRGMALYPADRPQDVAAFRQLLPGAAVLIARPPPPPPPPPRPPWLAGAGMVVAVAALAAVVAVGGAIWLSDAQRPPVALPSVTATPAAPTATPAAPTATAGPGAAAATDRTGAEYVAVPPAYGVAAFRIMRTEVTNAQYARCVAAGVCSEPRATTEYERAAFTDHPVVHVTRAQAQTYAAWVGGGLPTEAQWLRACQGDDGRTYPWGDQQPDGTRANYGEVVNDSVAVGSYPAGASPYGALDMAGNVREWAADGDYVVRGGAFGVDAGEIACTARFEFIVDSALRGVGFRVAAPVP